MIQWNKSNFFIFFPLLLCKDDGIRIFFSLSSMFRFEFYFIVCRTNVKKSIQSLKKIIKRETKVKMKNLWFFWQQINVHVCFMPIQYLCLANWCFPRGYFKQWLDCLPDYNLVLDFDEYILYIFHSHCKDLFQTFQISELCEVNEIKYKIEISSVDFVVLNPVKSSLCTSTFFLFLLYDKDE